MRYALGLDASTQSFSALLLDLVTPSVVASESVSFSELPEFGSPQGFLPGSPDGVVHADPRLWLAAMELLFDRLKRNGWPLSEVAAIAGSGQQHGSVYLNERFHDAVSHLNPAQSLAAQLQDTFSRTTAPIWMDRSTTRECEEINVTMGGADIVCKQSGSIATERFTGPQIRAFAHRNPEQYAATKRIHLVSSFLCSVLAGSDAAIDPGDGAGMNLMDLARQQWQPDLLAATAPDLQRRLPAIQPSTTFAGAIAEFFVSRYGFSGQCQVLLFTGDNPSSLVGMGASQPGKVVVSLGTSDTLFEAMTEPQTDPQGCRHVFGNPMGGYMTLACIRNGSLAREAFRDQLGVDWTAFENAGSVDLPPDAICIPFVSDESTPKRSAGLHESRPDLEAPQRVRAFLEGQAFNLKSWLTSPPSELRLTGGASMNQGIAQIFADVFGVPVNRLSVSNSAALGAAIRAAVSVGADRASLESALCHANSALLPQHHEECELRYQRWRDAVLS